MRRDVLLTVLTFIGAALCWCPICREPGPDMPFWLPIAIVVLLTGLSAAISVHRWFPFFIASITGTLTGMCIGTLMPPTPTDDVIARGYIGCFIIIAASISGVLSLVAALVGRKLHLTAEKHRRAAWIAFGCCVAFGPLAALLSPPLVAWRIGRNERLATERFVSLNNAALRTKAIAAERCFDGQVLKKNYSGPPFSESDWLYIVGNYVKQDGYVFGIWCQQTERGGYTIDAYPVRPKVDGTRRFCTDESGKTGCGMEWSRTRNVCTPCSK